MVAALVIGTNASPSVTLASPLDRVVDAGGSASFAAMALGSSPLNYQWLLNGAAIPARPTPPTYIINAQSTNTGNYSVIVTNNSGSVTSSAVSLLVYPIQTTVFSDSFDTEFRRELDRQ